MDFNGERGTASAGVDGVAPTVTRDARSLADADVRGSGLDASIPVPESNESAYDLDVPRSATEPGVRAASSSTPESGISAHAADVPGSTPESVDPALAAEQAKPGPLLRLVRRQEVAFAAVGGFNTALGIGLTIVWLAVLGDNVPPSVAVAAAYAVSIVIAFVLHRTLVFRVRGHLLRDFVRFVAVNSGGLLLNMVLLELAVSVWHFPDKPAAVVVMALVAVASYFGHRHISFRRRPPVEPDHVVG